MTQTVKETQPVIPNKKEKKRKERLGPVVTQLFASLAEVRRSDLPSIRLRVRVLAKESLPTPRDHFDIRSMHTISTPKKKTHPECPHSHA